MFHMLVKLDRFHFDMIIFRLSFFYLIFLIKNVYLINIINFMLVIVINKDQNITQLFKNKTSLLFHEIWELEEHLFIYLFFVSSITCGVF